MKVSVIIAAYNVEHHIEKCLNTIINQTLKDMEVIVVNDGSTDKTVYEINKIVKNDKRVIIINQENKGSIEARRRGLELATGEYILFVDADDWLELNALERLYEKAKSENYDIVLYDFYMQYDNFSKPKSTFSSAQFSNENLLRDLFIGNITPTLWSKFIKKEYITLNDIKIPSKISFGEDLAFVSSIFMHNPKTAILHKNLYYYYQRDNSITNNYTDKEIQICNAIDFIEKELIRNEIYEEYESEFKYLIYMHLLIYRIIGADKINNNIYKKIYNAYKDKKINIYKNDYIKLAIKEYPILTKLNVISYDLNFYIGKFGSRLKKLKRKKNAV